MSALPFKRAIDTNRTHSASVDPAALSPPCLLLRRSAARDSRVACNSALYATSTCVGHKRTAAWNRMSWPHRADVVPSCSSPQLWWSQACDRPCESGGHVCPANTTLDDNRALTRHRAIVPLQAPAACCSPRGCLCSATQPETMAKSVQLRGRWRLTHLSLTRKQADKPLLR
jgi:hypothetical protein